MAWEVFQEVKGASQGQSVWNTRWKHLMSESSVGQGFTMALLISWAREFFVRGSCPVNYRVFSSIFGLYPLDASSTCLPLRHAKKMSPDPAKGPLGVSSGGAKSPLAENQWCWQKEKEQGQGQAGL